MYVILRFLEEQYAPDRLEEMWSAPSLNEARRIAREWLWNEADRCADIYLFSGNGQATLVERVTETENDVVKE